MTQTRGALLTPGASRWRSVTTQPCREPRKLGLGSVVQTENWWYPCRQEANIKPSMLCMSRKEVFQFRFTPDSLEMCLETPSAAELGTVAFYSLTKCCPQSQLNYLLSPLWPNTLAECMKNKAARSDNPFSFTVVCPVFQTK